MMTTPTTPTETTARATPPAPEPTLLDFLALVFDAPDTTPSGDEIRASQAIEHMDYRIWLELRDLHDNRPEAARRLWRAILDAKALPDDVIGPADDVIGSFPDRWRTSIAWAALTEEATHLEQTGVPHGLVAFAANDAPSDPPKAEGAELALVWLVFVAWADACLDDQTEDESRSAFAVTIAEAVQALADATTRERLLEVRERLAAR